LTAVVFIVLVNSAFSSFSFYLNINFTNYKYLQNSGPEGVMLSILTLFWISLIISLNLFFFTLLFISQFNTTDWFLLEYVFPFLVSNCHSSWALSAAVIWFNLLLSIFLKCGLVPFYFWKPIFFKNLPSYSLFVYIVLFYFLLLLFLIPFLLSSVGELFMFFNLCNILFLSLGFICIFLLLVDTYYVKTFLATSSILNTFLVFLALCAIVETVNL
jgi:hypothetical protein